MIFFPFRQYIPYEPDWIKMLSITVSQYLQPLSQEELFLLVEAGKNLGLFKQTRHPSFLRRHEGAWADFSTFAINYLSVNWFKGINQSYFHFFYSLCGNLRAESDTDTVQCLLPNFKQATFFSLDSEEVIKYFPGLFRELKQCYKILQRSSEWEECLIQFSDIVLRDYISIPQHSEILQIIASSRSSKSSKNDQKLTDSILNCRRLIGTGKYIQAFNLAERELMRYNLAMDNDQLLLLKSQYSDLESQFRISVLPLTDYYQIRNRIISSFLQYLTEIQIRN